MATQQAVYSFGLYWAICYFIKVVYYDSAVISSEHRIILYKGYYVHSIFVVESARPKLDYYSECVKIYIESKEHNKIDRGFLKNQ
jgi:hypothetical protein